MLGLNKQKEKDFNLLCLFIESVSHVKKQHIYTKHLDILQDYHL